MNTILTINGCKYPKAEVQRTDNEAGLLIFRWLDAAENPVDSGNSVARFTPQWTFEEGDLESVPVEPTDEVLIAAIENQPAAPAPVVVLTPLTVLGRLTPPEEAALASSTDLAVAIVRNRLIAASEIRSDDPRTAEGRAILVAKGIITEARAAEIFA